MTEPLPCFTDGCQHSLFYLWLLDSCPSTEITSDEASVNSKFLDTDECASRPADRWVLQSPNGKQEPASTLVWGCTVQYVSHPACDSGVSLGLGDKVAEQSVGAEEVQADIGSLGKVLQHWWVGKVFGPRAAIDQRHHNLENADVFINVFILIKTAVVFWFLFQFL